MRLITGKNVTLHLIDDNFLLFDDIDNKYSWRDSYEIYYYPSTDKFIADISRLHLSGHRVHILIIAASLSMNGMDSNDFIINKVRSMIPGIHVINTSNNRSFESKDPVYRQGNVIQIINNENIMFRIDNAVKLILAGVRLDLNKRFYRLAFLLLIGSVIISMSFLIAALLS